MFLVSRTSRPLTYVAMLMHLIVGGKRVHVDYAVCILHPSLICTFIGWLRSRLHYYPRSSINISSYDLVIIYLYAFTFSKLLFLAIHVAVFCYLPSTFKVPRYT